MPHLSLSLLGTFQATLDGQPIAGFESNKVRALLAYLAVEAGRPHARDELTGLLWPDQPDAAARANLRKFQRLARGDLVELCEMRMCYIKARSQASERIEGQSMA